MTAMMKTLRFGIEIETIGLSKRRLAYTIQSVTGGIVSLFATDSWSVTDSTGRMWKVVHDGSLSDEIYSGEIVSPILHYDDLEMLHRIVRALALAGARTDYSTGIHCHIDGAKFNVKSIGNLVKFVHKQERLLEHVLDITERRLLKYCQSIDSEFLGRLERFRPRTMEQLSKAWYGDLVNDLHRRKTRYRGINLHSFVTKGTIEFRYFNGTLDADEVKAYVHLALAIAGNALGSKAASSKRREFNPETAKYDFRVVLLRLGLIGDEFRTTRRCLLKRLAGSAAWKRGRRDRSDVPAVPASDAADDAMATTERLTTIGDNPEQQAFEA